MELQVHVENNAPHHLEVEARSDFAEATGPTLTTTESRSRSGSSATDSTIVVSQGSPRAAVGLLGCWGLDGLGGCMLSWVDGSGSGCSWAWVLSLVSDYLVDSSLKLFSLREAFRAVLPGAPAWHPAREKRLIRVITENISKLNSKYKQAVKTTIPCLFPSFSLNNSNQSHVRRTSNSNAPRHLPSTPCLRRQ
jgi:hypothetical protein